MLSYKLLTSTYGIYILIFIINACCNHNDHLVKKYDIFLDLKHFFDIIVLMFFNVEEVDKNEDDFPAKEETEI